MEAAQTFRLGLCRSSPQDFFFFFLGPLDLRMILDEFAGRRLCRHRLWVVEGGAADFGGGVVDATAVHAIHDG